MHITESLYSHVIVLLAVLAFAWFAFGLARKAIVDQAVSITRITQDGEQLTMSLNFSIFDSYEARRAKLMATAKLGDDRVKFADEKFKAHLAEEIAKQSAGAKVKSV